MIQARSIQDVPIHEREIFAGAGVELVEICLRYLSRNNLMLWVMPEGRGSARLLNLLQWNAHEALEYVDGDGPFADQVVHYALHMLLDRRYGSDHPQAMLFAEAVASAADFYLLGKLISAGVDCDFVADSLDSFGSYYAQYGDEDFLETLLQRCSFHPWRTMGEVARYLFDSVVPLITIEDPAKAGTFLLGLQDDPLYPLLHHYHITNWVLTLRNRFPGAQDRAFDAAAAFRGLFSNEDRFLEQFEAHYKE